MPESKSRKAAELKKKNVRRAEAAGERSTKQRRTPVGADRNWVLPTFVTLMLLGVLWLVVWYITAATGTYIPGLSDLGSWNMAIGMGLMIAGFGVATQWK